MKQIMMSVLLTSGLLGSFALPAMAQTDSKKTPDCCTWSYVTEGRRAVRKTTCVNDEAGKMPSTMRVEVKPEDRQSGDDWGLKIVGKRTERVYYREVPRPAQAAANTDCEHAKSKDDCNASFFTVGKRSERKVFCDRNDTRVMCGDKQNECKVCQKGM